MRTIDKIRAALDQDVSTADVYVGWYTLVGIVVSVIGLLAIGGGR